MANTEKRGRRVGLTRERVVAAAVTLVDRDGLEGFSLRRLAAELGVDPMSIYNHVENKDDLLDAVVASVMAEISLSTDELTPWPDQVRDSARSFRKAALAHPNVATLMLTRRVLTGVPLDLLRDAVAPAVRAGLSASEALDVVRTLTAFLTGAILRELGAGLSFAVADPSVVAQRVAEIGQAGDDLALVATSVAEIDHERLFERGLDLFLAGLNAIAAPASGPADDG